jgi:hypothetical protein
MLQMTLHLTRSSRLDISTPWTQKCFKSDYKNMPFLSIDIESHHQGPKKEEEEENKEE